MSRVRILALAGARVCRTRRLAALMLPLVIAAAALRGQSLHARVDDSVHATAEWLERVAVETDRGLRWPADPRQPKQNARSLYSGTPGVVLFFAMLDASQASDRWRKIAERGAQQILADIEDETWIDCGLYTGLAGAGFVLHELASRWKDATLRRGVDRVCERIRELTRKTEHGVRWSGVTDIISGSAGTGLFLLHAGRERDLAVAAGDDLLARGTKTEAGMLWRMTARYEREMPNFSHGTAGVAFFLSRLYAVTGKRRFQAAAREGLAELRARSKNGWIEHHRPGGEELFYLGWCHGPIGTAILYDALDDKDALRATLRAIRASGAPEKRSPGFWNNSGVCCGTAGILRFAQRIADAELAERCVRDLLDRVTRDDRGARWVHCEHRVRPALKLAQTGWMQGAAGIATRLLQWRHPKLKLVLPDEPRSAGSPKKVVK